MIQWINTNFGTDVATYLSLVVGIIALFTGGKQYNKIRNKKRIKQTAEETQGDVYQAGRDVIHTTNIYQPSIDTKTEQSKKEHDHDLKIIDEILALLPYEDTKNWVEQSYITGLPQDICLNMEKMEKFTNEKYRLFNTETNVAKNAFIESTLSFVDSTLPFLHIDHPQRVPLMLNLPHDWKYKGKESENNFRKHQSNMRITSKEMINLYDNFVKTFKEHGFITDKL